MASSKGRSTLYLFGSGALFLISALAFLANYFAITMSVLENPSRAQAERTVYELWSGIFIVVLCVSGIVFYASLRGLIKDRASAQGHSKK